MFIQPRGDGLTASHRAPFVPSGSRFSPCYFRVVGRSHEFAFTVTTASQQGMRHKVFTWWFQDSSVSYFFDVLTFFCMGLLGSIGLGSSFLPQMTSRSGSPCSF
mgnify:CR=1 FL=1